jgi:hypothetical protein
VPPSKKNWPAREFLVPQNYQSPLLLEQALYVCSDPGTTR